jgi:hypothetical protein
MTTRRGRGAIVGSCLVLSLFAVLPSLGGQDRQDGADRLTGLARKYKTDKGPDAVGSQRPGHFYTEVYEKFFSPLTNETRKVCEIGIETGASLRMWRDYFPRAVIYGIDIVDSSRLDSERIRTFVADQADRAQLARFITFAGSDFDLVVDDGGHSMRQQQVSFGYLFSRVKPGGYYVIEDVHTSLPPYEGSYGVDRDGRNTTLAMIDTFVRRGQIESRYMTLEELAYLTAHVEFCNLFSRDRGHSIACMFKKKG